MKRSLAFAISLAGACLASAVGSEPLIIAHRGASAAAPENTMAAFARAWDLGADGIEGDFRLTKDGDIVAVHDKDTKRVTGGKSTLVVAKTDFAELAKLDVGSWKGVEFAGERIPTLAQVLGALPAGKQLFIEIKCGVEIVEPLLEVLRAAEKRHPGIRSQLTIISFNETVIATCRERLPDIGAHFLKSFSRNKKTKAWSPSSEDLLRMLEKCRASGLDVQANTECVTLSLVKRLRDAGLEFHCWTVNDPAKARHFAELGVDSITTDTPAAIREALASEPALAP